MAATRGSDKLSSIRRRGLDEDQLAKLARLADDDEIELIDWLDRGIPAIDWAAVTVVTRPGRVGGVLDDLVRGGIARHIEVFPLGIPAIDRVQVRASTERPLR
jgi:hypothetical protein